MKIKLNEIKQTCGGCPTQYEGYTEEGDYVYMRYRHGGMTIDVNNINIMADTFYGKGGADGVCNFEDFVNVAKKYGIKIKVIS